MDDHYVDQDGNLCILRLMAQTRLPPNHPQHVSLALRDAIMRRRLAQIKRECAENVAALRDAAREGISTLI
jgi:hypothetical protein